MYLIKENDKSKEVVRNTTTTKRNQIDVRNRNPNKCIIKFQTDSL